MSAAHEIKPIFIVGSPRSGTTLLRFILSSHPNIFIPDETGFLPHLVKKSQVCNSLSLAETAKILARIAKLNYQWRDLVPDIPNFYHQLEQPTLQYVLDALYRQIITPYHAMRWGDKTPVYARHIALIVQIFPAAQIIHMIRDGRDATLSAQQKWGTENFWYMDNYYLLKNWVDTVTIGRLEGAVLTLDQYLEISYEQLVQFPKDSLQLICGFLGEPYDPVMLSHSDLARKIGPGLDDHTEVLNPITTQSVARWKTQMSTFDLKIADRIAGRILETLGYERYNPGEFTTSEKIKCFSLAIKYIFTASIRRLLYAVGVLTINRNHRKSPDD